MSFAAPLFLIAMSAVAAPILIHLIFRLKKRRVLFSTLKFLKVVEKKNKRRLRLREILLLLLRVAIIACIVLAFARPFLPGSEVEGEVLKGRTDMIIVLDDTFSMSADVNGKPLFDHAKDRIVEHVKRLKASDRVGLLCVSEPNRMRIALTDNAQVFVSRLRSRAVPQGFGAGTLLPAAKFATRELKGSLAANRIVVVVSDLQRTGWDAAALQAQPDALSKELRYEVVALPRAGDNLAVVGARPQSLVYVKTERVPFAVQVAGFGQANQERVLVTMHAAPPAGKTRAPGAPLAQTSVEIVKAGRTAEVRFDSPVEGPGETAGVVEIEARDALAGDDRFYWAARFRKQIRVLCVEEERASENKRFHEESYFVRQALDPRLHEDEDEERTGLFRADTVGRKDFNAQILARSDVVVLCSVPGLSRKMTDALATWVKAGGGLVVFVGGRYESEEGSEKSDRHLDPAFYKDLHARGVLPARLEAAEGSLDTFEGARRIRIDKLAAGHFIFRPFQGEFDQLITRGPGIRKYYRFVDEDLKSDGVRILARLDQQEPFLLERAHGKGATLQFATSAWNSWSDMPRHKAYVILLHGIARYLTRQKAGRRTQFLVGDALEYGLKPEDDQGALMLVTPEGNRVQISSRTPYVAERPGIYTLGIPRGDFLERRHAAVNIPPSESDLTALPADKLAADLGGGEVDDPSAVRTTTIDEDSHDELKMKVTTWRRWLVAALILLLAEALIANVLMRPK